MSSSYRVLMLALHVLFVLATCMYASEATFFPPPCLPPPPPPQNNTMTFYLQLTLANGTNNAVANAFPVAGIQGKASSLQQFGTVYVIDANVTTTPSSTAPLVGQAYGTLTAVDLNGLAYQVCLTIAFTSGQFAGSTLEVLGISAGLQQVSNIPIIGGSNAFTYAIGYITRQTISGPPNIIVKVRANYKFAA